MMERVTTAVSTDTAWLTVGRKTRRWRHKGTAEKVIARGGERTMEGNGKPKDGMAIPLEAKRAMGKASEIRGGVKEGHIGWTKISQEEIGDGLEEATGCSHSHAGTHQQVLPWQTGSTYLGMKAKMRNARSLSINSRPYSAASLTNQQRRRRCRSSTSPRTSKFAETS